MKLLNIFSLILVLLFVGCDNGSNDTSISGNNKIKVGATPIPHAKILYNIKDDLKKQGIDLEVVEFSDYILPNLALNDGSLDANFFQHQPYLDKMNADKNLSLKSIANVHIEPIGLYSKKYQKIEDLKDGSLIAMPNDPTNSGRAFILLHDNGIIKLRDPNNLYSSELDIIENPKKLKFKLLDAAMLPRVVDDVDVAIINSNYALQAGMKAKDAILLEDSKSPYVNVLAVRESDVNNPLILKLKETLLSNKTKDFINQTYDGEIIPAF